MALEFVTNFVSGIPFDFWSQLFATLLGIIAGVPVAFWVQRKIDTAKLVDEEKYLISFLRQNLKRNLELIQEAKKELPVQVIFYNLDLGAWNFVSQKITLIKDNSLAEDISKTYYQLGHLSRKIEKQFDMHYSSFAAMNNYQNQRQALITAILAHIDILERDIASILTRLSECE